MKQVFLPLVCSFLVLSASAQGKGNDYITLKQDGKVYWIRSGQTIKIAIPVPLKNGSTAYPDGSVQTKEGDVSKIAQGDKVLMNGTLVPKSKSKARKKR